MPLPPCYRPCTMDLCIKCETQKLSFQQVFQKFNSKKCTRLTIAYAQREQRSKTDYDEKKLKQCSSNGSIGVTVTRAITSLALCSNVKTKLQNLKRPN